MCAHPQRCKFHATSHQIKFTNWGHTCDICTELVVDDVSLYTIEELPGLPECNTAIDDAGDIARLSIFPNPFYSSVNFEFTLVHPQHISLMIYDINGRVVTKLVDRNLSAGNHHIEWESENDVPGVFYYHFMGEDGVEVTGTVVKL